MQVKNQLFIGGKWIDTNKKLDVINPADETLITQVSLSTDKEHEFALESAHQAFQSWSKTAPRVRAEILRKAFELMIANADFLSELITKENGKVLADSKSEILYAAEFFRWFSEEAVRIEGEYRTSPSGDKKILVTKQPIGVSVLITPWNFPAAMATRKLGPALAAGCTVILKPASETPLTAIAIVQLLEQAGVPAGVVNMVLPEKTGESISKMLHDKRVRNLSFTGSTEVGRLLLKEAADSVIRCSMELGGNAPFIVLDDADIDAAVAGAMIAKMRNGGAACTSANRFYVSEKIVKEFTEKFSKEMQKLKVGNGLDKSTQLGAYVSIKEREKITELVSASIKDGAKVEIGANKPNAAGAFYNPTVLSVKKDNLILEKEIFGPVAPIVEFKTDIEAIELANSTNFGLIGYVFSRNLSRALKVAEALESGMVAINRGVISDPAAPFGGYKQSGLGREGGFDGINEFLETKYMGFEIN